MTQARRKTAALPLKPVPRGTLPDEIYRQIRELILDGGIAPGELMTIQGLADGFGVSAMPVREALQRLTAEKALTIVSGRSVGIPELKASRLRDLYKVRLEVETMATVWAAETITGQDISRLEGLVAMMAKAIKDGDSRQYLRGNHDFHFTIYRASESQTILDMAEATGPEIFIRQETAILERADYRPSLAEIRCPTLVLVGADDGITPPPMAAEMAKAIAGARLEIVADCGHLSTLERPAETSASLESWLRA